jgi:hypothetical protein
MRESKYQADLRKRIENLLPGCLILKNDPTVLQGIPDLLILHNDRWAMLEVKVSEHAPTQPNQPYYVDRLDAMSFASFIYPEIEEDVLHELQLAFRTRRKTRVSQPK